MSIVIGCVAISKKTITFLTFPEERKTLSKKEKKDLSLVWF